MITLKEEHTELKLRKTNKTEDRYSIDFVDTEIGFPIGHFHYAVNKKEKSAFIHSVYLQEDYRKTGILKNNLDKIICDMVNRGAKTIELHAQTESAKQVWEKSGFIVIGEKTIDEEGVPLHYWEMKKKVAKDKCPY